MTREEQLRFCKVCELHSFDPKKGMTCSLTGERATFEDDCPDFKGDRSLVESPDGNNKKKSVTNDTFQRFTELFTPTNGYFITPILFHINLLVFIIMLIAGAHLFFPSPDFLIAWGANFSIDVLDGEYWRLLSNTFLHSGLLHLVPNLIALLFVGSLLEKNIGSLRTLVAYFVTGITASAVSFWWHDMTVSVGASGAIFGLFGVKIATLLTNPPDREEQKRLLNTFLILVVYNLMGGFQEGIDMAAHLGGLLSGIIYGFAIYPPFIRIKWVRALGESLVVILLGAGIYFTVVNKPKDMLEYAHLMDQFARTEHTALRLYRTSYDASPQSYLYTINNTGIPNWRACKIILRQADSLENLPPGIRERNELLHQYVDLRIQSYKQIFKAIAQSSNEYDGQIQNLTKQIDSLINVLAGEPTASDKNIEVISSEKMKALLNQ